MAGTEEDLRVLVARLDERIKNIRQVAEEIRSHQMKRDDEIKAELASIKHDILALTRFKSEISIGRLVVVEGLKMLTSAVVAVAAVGAYMSMG